MNNEIKSCLIVLGCGAAIFAVGKLLPDGIVLFAALGVIVVAGIFWWYALFADLGRRIMRINCDLKSKSANRKK